MDSGTHLVMGLGLAGLSMVDPVVAANSTVFAAVVAGTVIGSQAPDLDGLLRLKNNATYIKNHRGFSHSIPAALIWTLLITFAIQIVFKGQLPLLHVGGWVMLAVAVHIISDLFNSYGTQAARPFSKRWISWNIIHIFDPVIFVSHLIAILLWVAGVFPPAAMFPVFYALIVCYYAWRTTVHYRLETRLAALDPESADKGEYVLIPTLSLFTWNVVKQLKDGSFVIGDLKNQRVRWLDRARCDDHPAVNQSKNDPAIQSFLYLTSFACAEVKEYSWGYEVRWSDVRYRHRKQYPFVAVLMLDLDYRTIGSYVGWLSDDRLKKRLRMNTY
ncbi:metal-dependent hydrolase [Paenibacillaceae bacterium]|nr:metal-dependent hydrolase [Paenibacillaceae bacterium]